MIGIDNKKIIRVMYEADQVTKLEEKRMTLVEFADWYVRAQQRAKTSPIQFIKNGVNGLIVITEKRYFVIEIR